MTRSQEDSDSSAGYSKPGNTLLGVAKMRVVNSKFARDPMPEVLPRSHVPRVFFDRCDAGSHALVTNVCRCAAARCADQFVDDVLRRIAKGAA